MASARRFISVSTPSSVTIGQVSATTALTSGPVAVYCTHAAVTSEADTALTLSDVAASPPTSIWRKSALPCNLSTI